MPLYPWAKSRLFTSREVQAAEKTNKPKAIVPRLINFILDMNIETPPYLKFSSIYNLYIKHMFWVNSIRIWDFLVEQNKINNLLLPFFY